ncbi:DNA polymerase III subunit delta [Methyloligella halotolerans]|uniref:DNA-directed DNA polymerase n=1 Tax=Methyloligella halotolerans TaxID=1177755 RepID=A0A1E2S119_9HYPH|nr:DNA polymerase III subunit delta [Methyloligella halotolerans]ODA68019.1 DNA polymerase III subunit delta [Methyloligella halotolerans]
MVAVKSSGVSRFLKSPDPSCRAVLVYGPDTGLVSERAATLQKHFAHGAVEAEVIRLDDRDFAEMDGRLSVELGTMPMFSDRKVVRVAAGARLNPDELKAALAEPPEAALIIEAGNLRPDSAIRKLFEKLPHAAALPCYAEERNLGALIDEELSAAKLNIDRETRSYLMDRLGADQALSRSEIDKLILYARGKDRIGPDDIDAVVGDSAEVAVENFVYLVSAGDSRGAIRQLSRLAGAGTPPQVALAALGRHFTKLHMVAAAESSSGSAESALRKIRPPIHFKRRDAFVRDSRRWGAQRLQAALPRIQEAVMKARLSPPLEQAHAERLVLALRAR